MEPQELPPALLRTPVSVVDIVVQLLVTLPSRDEMMLLPALAMNLYWDLEEFTNKLWASLECIQGTWRHCGVTSNDDDDDTVTSLSHALAAYKSTPGAPQNRVKMVACKWQGSVSVLVDSWAQVVRKATELRNTCREMAAVAATEAATATAWARDLQDEAAILGTVQKNLVELGQGLGGKEDAKMVAEHEARVSGEALEAVSEATRATMVRQRVEVALELLERLVAACDEATAFPRELQRLLRDIEAALEGTNEASPNVPEDLVAKVAMAEQLWGANAHLAKDDLLETLDYFIKFYLDGAPASPGGCEVAELCLRDIEDIPRLLRPPERPQGVPKRLPVSHLHLQALVAVVATLGEVVTSVTGPHRGKFLHASPDSLHEDLKNFTRSLCKILDHGDVTSLGNSSVPSLSQALATLRATPGTTWANLRATASSWRNSVAMLVDSLDWLARVATELCDTCREVVVAQQLIVALDKEEVAQEMATHDAQVAAATNEAVGEAVVATRRAMLATRKGHWAEVALGPLQRLVATCDKATLFNWNVECQLKEIEAILKGINEVFPVVPEGLVAKVAEFERLWVASAHLAKDHLLGALGDIHNILLSPCGGLSSRAVAKRCQKAIEDIPRLLQESVTWGQ